MEDKLIEYADELIAALKAGVEFTVDQLPLVAQEVLMYYTYLYTFQSVLYLVMIILFVYFWRLSYRNMIYYPMEHYELLVIICSLVIFISTLLFVKFLLLLLKVVVAPRLFLIEKLTQLF